MAENKMEQVAAMFGKKLGEEFKLRFKGENYVKFDKEKGMLQLCVGMWYVNNALLKAILTGQAEIVEGE